jgi:hypothetical protein
MARCPNCGQPTARTSDWCCQWCGYPLFSGSFKKIDKTYKELREERSGGKTVEEEIGEEEKPVEEFEVEESEEEPEEEVEPEAEIRPKRRVRPGKRRRRIVKPQPEPVEEEPEEEEEYEEEEYEEEEEEPEVEGKTKPKARPAARRKKVRKPEPEPVEEEPEEEEYEEEEGELEEEEEYEEEKEYEEEEEEPEVVQPAMELTVDEVISAYETEGTAADPRFANKILRISGTVDKVEVKAVMDIYSISLVGSSENSLRQRVRCVFSREHVSELQQLVAGQEVTVQGKYDGSIISISMRDCVLVQ